MTGADLPMVSAVAALVHVALPEDDGGAARAAVGRLAAVAARRGLGRMALTAVAGTAGIWGRLGFVATDAPGLAGKLATYGPGAAYMLTRPPDRR
jgi:hypothetical protein